MPLTITNSAIAAFKKAAEQEIKKRALACEVEKSALRRLSDYSSNPDGSLPCPICFISYENNLLTVAVGGSFNCSICGFVIHRDIS